MKEQAACVTDDSTMEFCLPENFDSTNLGSMTLVDIRSIVSKLEPPYPDRLFDILEKDGRAGAKDILNRLKARQLAAKRDRLRIESMLEHERQARADGFEVIAGIDEVGRGPLAGPVVAAAVILPPELRLSGINDSKMLTEAQRCRALSEIVAVADFGLGVVSPEQIDRLNIYRANLLAVRLALEDLAGKPDIVLIDGKPVPDLGIPQRAIVKGDKLSVSIAAASIVAKVVRDRMMLEFDKKYPQYGFARHKGYGTTEHLSLLRKNGASPIHRRSFAPVRNTLRDEGA